MLLEIKFKAKNFIIKQFSFWNQIIPHNRNKILIYDAGADKIDNSAALFDFLVKEGYNRKYKIIYACATHNQLSKTPIKNVAYVGKIGGLLHFMTTCNVYYRANWLKIKPAKGQHTIQMWHGSPIKRDANAIPQDYDVNPYFTGFLSASEHFDPIYSEVFRVPTKRMIRCGHPRTDDLFKPSPEYDFGEYKKIIIWTPTYRKRQKKAYGDVKQVANEDTLLPLIPEGRFKEVNDYLKGKQVKVVVKLHPLQSLENYNLTEFDHFVFLSHHEFIARNMSLYPFMKQCDAMITDYSSIYWDYLVLDRPIGFTEDDIEEYADGRGFIMKDPEKFKPGPKLCSIDDFYQFIEEIAYGIDNYKEQRKEINAYGNPVTDGHSCKRALEAIGVTL